MKLARSTFYYRARRAAAEKLKLRDQIISLCEEFPRYGYRRVTAHLRNEGMMINHKTVSCIMGENGHLFRWAFDGLYGFSISCSL